MAPCTILCPQGGPHSAEQADPGEAILERTSVADGSTIGEETQASGCRREGTTDCHCPLCGIRWVDLGPWDAGWRRAGCVYYSLD